MAGHRMSDAELVATQRYIECVVLAPLYMSIMEQTLAPEVGRTTLQQWRNVMSMRLLFWILMLLCALGVIGGFAAYYGPYTHLFTGGTGLIAFLLFALLGWKVFGKPIEG